MELSLEIQESRVFLHKLETLIKHKDSLELNVSTSNLFGKFNNCINISLDSENLKSEESGYCAFILNKNQARYLNSFLNSFINEVDIDISLED